MLNTVWLLLLLLLFHQQLLLSPSLNMVVAGWMWSAWKAMSRIRSQINNCVDTNATVLVNAGGQDRII